MWLITPYSDTAVRNVNSTCSLNGYSISSNELAVRPSITLKSSIKITGGTGMENDPFEISE